MIKVLHVKYVQGGGGAHMHESCEVHQLQLRRGVSAASEKRTATNADARASTISTAHDTRTVAPSRRRHSCRCTSEDERAAVG
jgi:hypothetical protein